MLCVFADLQTNTVLAVIYKLVLINIFEEFTCVSKRTKEFADDKLFQMSIQAGKTLKKAFYSQIN